MAMIEGTASTIEERKIAVPKSIDNPLARPEYVESKENAYRLDVGATGPERACRTSEGRFGFVAAQVLHERRFATAASASCRPPVLSVARQASQRER
jgi:hypothetical protein